MIDRSLSTMRAFTVLALVVVSIGACGFRPSRQPVVRLATTTSTRDSGLLDHLLPQFEQQHQCRVDVIALGTGAALKLGESGDVDAVLVHARAAEMAFMAAGHGVRHAEVMSNRFVLLGPDDDPAGVRKHDAAAALRAICDKASEFISRGDDSGTHKKELSLWEAGGGRPTWPGYLESGQGMGATLVMANEKQAYVLSDMATYLNLRDKLQLAVLTSECETLQNPYAVMVVNPAKHPGVNRDLADQFVDFLLSPETQSQIGAFAIQGKSLFVPALSLPAEAHR